MRKFLIIFDVILNIIFAALDVLADVILNIIFAALDVLADVIISIIERIRKK